VKAGLARARANGRRLGRPGHRLSAIDIERSGHLAVRAAARVLAVSPALVHKLRSQTPRPFAAGASRKSAAQQPSLMPFTNRLIYEH
jgi:hypothetical protein